MTHAQLGKLYLCSIIKGSNWGAKDGPTFEERPITDGLALEYKSDDGRFVIAMIRYDADEDTYRLESVGDRLMTYLTPENLESAQYLCRYAERLMRDEYERLHGEEY